MLYTTQRPNELGYTYDLLDLRLNNHTFLTEKATFIGILKSNQNKILFPEAVWSQFKDYLKKHYSKLPGRID